MLWSDGSVTVTEHGDSSGEGAVETVPGGLCRAYRRSATQAGAMDARNGLWHVQWVPNAWRGCVELFHVQRNHMWTMLPRLFGEHCGPERDANFPARADGSTFICAKKNYLSEEMRSV